jgi:hypothetical protein
MTDNEAVLELTRLDTHTRLDAQKISRSRDLPLHTRDSLVRQRTKSSDALAHAIEQLTGKTFAQESLGWYTIDIQP